MSTTLNEIQVLQTLSMDILSPDLVFKCLSFLKVKEIYRCCETNRRYHGELHGNQEFWQFYCEQVSTSAPHLQEMLLNNQYAYSSCSSSASVASRIDYSKMARVLEGVQETNITVSKRTKAEVDLSMEGHAACLVLDRFLCIVGGWGSEGNNHVHIFDCADLPNLSRIDTVTRTFQRFKYGFTVITQPGGSGSATASSSPGSGLEGSMLMFGGCCNGGYSGDCNGMLCRCYFFILSLLLCHRNWI